MSYDCWFVVQKAWIEREIMGSKGATGLRCVLDSIAVSSKLAMEVKIRTTDYSNEKWNSSPFHEFSVLMCGQATGQQCGTAAATKSVIVMGRGKRQIKRET